MSQKQVTVEKIIGMLREAEVALVMGRKWGRIAWVLGYRSKLRDKVLNRKGFFTLEEAKVVIEN